MRDGRTKLRYRGKHGLLRELTITDTRLSRLIRQCRDVPGQHLFQDLDDEGHRQPIDSGQVNEYLHQAMGETFTAKTFRTWGATMLAVAAFADVPRPSRASAQPRLVKQVVTSVAEVLGNTPTVCRQSYVHPVVIQAWSEGWLDVDAKSSRFPRKLEAATLALLRRAHRHEPQQLAA